MSVVSERAARVELALEGGHSFDARLFPLPEWFIGRRRCFLALLPEDVKVQGQVIAYDANGSVLQRGFIGDKGEPSGPTAEIDAAWRSLFPGTP